MLRDGMPVGVAKPCLAFVETNPSFFLLSSGFQIPPYKIDRFVGQIAELRPFDELRLAELLLQCIQSLLELTNLTSPNWPVPMHFAYSLLDELQVTWRL